MPAGAWQALLGLAVLTALAWAISEDRRAIRLRVPLAGLALQLAIALLLLRVPQIGAVFDGLNDGVLALLAATRSGTTFVFGYLGGGGLDADLRVRVAAARDRRQRADGIADLLARPARHRAGVLVRVP